MINNSLSMHSAPSPTFRSSNSSLFTHQMVNSTFATQKTTEDLINEHFQDLNRYINSLDPRIKQLIEYNEAELLIAYRNHFKKISIQIQRFKDETLSKIKNEANVLAKMDKMQRQLIVFRDEALRLFELVTEKDKQIEKLSQKLDELTSERSFLNWKVKEYMKEKKESHIKEDSHDQLFKPFKQPSSQNKTEYGGRTVPSLGIHSYKRSVIRDKKMKDRTLTVLNCESSKVLDESDRVEESAERLQTSTITNFSQKKEDLLSTTFKYKFAYLQSNILTDIITTAQEVFSKIEREKQFKLSKQSFFTTSMKAKSNLRSRSYSQAKQTKPYVMKSKEVRIEISPVSLRQKQMREFFEKCVETVKKEVARRKSKTNRTLFTDGRSITIEEFKKADIGRLLELVFANDNVRYKIEECLVGRKSSPMK